MESQNLFDAHVALLQLFIAQRAGIVGHIDRQLNCQKEPLEYQQDQAGMLQHFLACFFSFPGLTAQQVGLRDELELAHWASGFKPRDNPGNDIIDPAALMVRGFHFWRQTRWPGQKARVRFAHTLFNVYLLRRLTLLLLRLWDADHSGAGARLQQAQAVLDALWQSTPKDLPVLVRDVRWLFPVAMSPTTDTLDGYFRIAQLIDETLPAADRLAIQRAMVQTGSGHLRSQLRHLAVQQAVPVDAHKLVLVTRVSNALDVALLLQGLVTLLNAYQQAMQAGDSQQRLALAAAICEGVSPDPQLFINRLELLGPYTMIEHLFIATAVDGSAGYTPTGLRHLQLLQDYKALISRLSVALHADCQQLGPAADGYSPYGVLFGFSSNILELTAFKTLQFEAETRFSMEDAFTSGDATKRSWVNGWRNLPHIKPEVVKQYEYPAQFAAGMHARVEQQLQQRAVASEAAPAAATGRLCIVASEDAHAAQVLATELAHVPALPAHYIHSSDPQLVAAGKAEAKDQHDMLYCRLEGEYLVSYQTAGGWVGITKDMLTETVGAGQDVKLVGLPQQAGAVLQLMGRELVAVGR